MKSLEGTFLVIGCGKAKIWDRQPHLGRVCAKDAYTGSLFRLSKLYAETYYPDRWLIISAKYGLILPEELIEKYDISFKSGKKANKSAVVTVSTLKKQCMRYFPNEKKIVCIAGKEYIFILKSAVQKKLQVDCPLTHMGLYARMAWLKKKVSNTKASHL